MSWTHWEQHTNTHTQRRAKKKKEYSKLILECRNHNKAAADTVPNLRGHAGGETTGKYFNKEKFTGG